MEKQIVAGAVFLLTFISPTPGQPQTSQSSQTVSEATHAYTVAPGDSLATIAASQYSDSEYWTTIWNDNLWIKDSNLIEAGQKLKIRNKKPDEPDKLKAELSTRYNKKNQLAYSFTTSNPDSNQTPSNPNPSPQSLSDDQINFLGTCESGLTAERNSGNGFYGAFQFTPSTWNNMATGYGRPDLAPLEVQKNAVQRLLQNSSIYTQFPGCSAKMRSSGLL